MVVIIESYDIIDIYYQGWAN